MSLFTTYVVTESDIKDVTFENLSDIILYIEQNKGKDISKDWGIIYQNSNTPILEYLHSRTGVIWRPPIQ